jgi:uncharacterized protein YdhG (YjbR/CyaY superfamily)
LATLSDVEDEIKRLGHHTLEERLETLRGQVKNLLENQEEEIKYLCDKIHNLKHEINEIKEKHKKLENELAVAQATWVWEAHVARFVVDSSKRIYPRGKFGQMERYLKTLKNPKDDRWAEIKKKLTEWTHDHRKVVETVRAERNSIAHPSVMDLDLVEFQIKEEMSPDDQKLMKDMLDMLKMTASLMKFGLLATFYNTNKRLFPTASGRGMDARALHDIISWNRNIDDINGLQCIEHSEAREYMAKYVNDRRAIKHYFFIVDSIKDGNKKRLGKLAWKIEASGILGDLSPMHGEALKHLKKLLPNPRDEREFLYKTMAKLHVPDFLPKPLWKHGIEIIEKFFK